MAANALKIGRIWDIPIYLDWIFLLLMFFVYYISPLLFLLFLLLFLCAFIHELAHAYTSLNNKIKVSEITIYPWGGATVIDENLVKPGNEFNIAVAGPLMSLFLGGLFGIFVSFSPPGLPTYILQVMFELNIALGLFNLIPAFPLDGGKVFRSYLQRSYDSFKATMKAVTLSKYMTVLLVVGSIVYLSLIKASIEFKATDFIIFIFVAYILYAGAEAEKESTILKRNTKGLTIQKAIGRDFIVVESGMELKRLYKLIEKKGMSTVLTKVNGKFMLLDLFRKHKTGAAKAQELAVEIPEMKPNTPVMDALRTLEMSGKGIGVVVSKSRPVGVITSRHLDSLISLHILSKNQADNAI